MPPRGSLGWHRFLRYAFRLVAPFTAPHRICLHRVIGQHEGRRRLAFARTDLAHGSSGSDGPIEIEERLRFTRFRELVAMLDEQPIVPPTARAVILQAHQDPAAPESFSPQRELELAVLQGELRILDPDGSPVASIPQLDRASSILTFRNRALEIAVVERMILHFHREAR